MFIYVGGGAGTKVALHVYKVASVVLCRMQKLSSKAGFRSFRTIFHQNTLLTSRTNRKCAQECLIGKKWVLGLKSYNVSKGCRSAAVRMCYTNHLEWALYWGKS